MIKELFKKELYIPITKISDTKYELMWDKTDIMEYVYQTDENGEYVLDQNGLLIAIDQIETDYCSCCHETVGLPKNMTNIISMIDNAMQMGYGEPSVQEWIAWSEIFSFEDERLSILKTIVKNKATKYDSSNNINNFTIGKVNMWLDKQTRVGLKLRFESEKQMGMTNTTLWYNGVSFTLGIDDAINMLFAIEMYASACYDNTQKHLSAIDNITTIEELNQYDFTTGYPDKLNFDYEREN